MVVFEECIVALPFLYFDENFRLLKPLNLGTFVPFLNLQCVMIQETEMGMQLCFVVYKLCYFIVGYWLNSTLVTNISWEDMPLCFLSDFAPFRRL